MMYPDNRGDGADTDGDGNVVRFHDLPEAYRGNVNVTEAPYNRKLGGTNQTMQVASSARCTTA